MMLFRSFIFRETYLSYREYFNLNCYIGKKSAENFPYGFQNLVKFGVRNFFFKITAGRMVFNFSCKTSGFALVCSLFELKNIFFEIFLKSA